MSKTMQKRINFSISSSQSEAMKRIIIPTKTSQSDFIRVALDERLDRINKQQLEEKLEEGYKAMAEEHKRFAKLSAKAAAEVVPDWK
ncbi:hypothetical protein GH153_06255 [bacterium]|nr:hypothetical protein [bacterium]